MTSIERVVGVHVVAGLLAFVEPRVEVPLVFVFFPVEAVDDLAVDVDGGEECEPTLAVHHDAVVVIRQNVFVFAIARLAVDGGFSFQLAGEPGKRHAPAARAEKVRVVAAPVFVVAVNLDNRLVRRV